MGTPKSSSDASAPGSPSSVSSVVVTVMCGRCPPRVGRSRGHGRPQPPRLRHLESHPRGRRGQPAPRRRPGRLRPLAARRVPHVRQCRLRPGPPGPPAAGDTRHRQGLRLGRPQRPPRLGHRLWVKVRLPEGHDTG
jgi:hypothetical protein